MEKQDRPGGDLSGTNGAEDFILSSREPRLRTDLPLKDGQELVVYQGKDGRLWARPINEFHDGRFVLCPTDEPME